MERARRRVAREGLAAVLGTQEAHRRDSQRMLTLTLRGLERDGLVTRTVTPSIPPRVDYELTALGQSLRCPIDALGEWAFANRDQIEAARARFDQAADRG